MKRWIAGLGAAAWFLVTAIPAFAGDVPEMLLQQDDALVFVGTVESYTLSEDGTVASSEVLPTLVLKGAAAEGTALSFPHCDFGSRIPAPDTEYLFGYIDANNFYLYEIAERTDSFLRLADADRFDQTRRLQDYLNDGSFARAEEERASLGQQIRLAAFLEEAPLSDSPVETVVLTCGDRRRELDPGQFAAAVQDIVLTNVKNRDITDFDSLLFIEQFAADGRLVSYAAVTPLGEVDRYNLFMSRLMTADYTMAEEDLSALSALLPSAEQPAPSKMPPAGWIFGGALLLFGVVLVVFVRRRRKKANQNKP